jgi:hypothetical protein
MRRSVIAVTLTGLAHGAALGEGVRFSVAVEKPVGFAWYDLEAFGPKEEFDGADARSMIRSELNYPLDPFRLDLGLSGFRPGGGDAREGLKTELRLWSSAGPAWMRMRDEDWLGASAENNTTRSDALLKFSDTYSEAETWQLGGWFHRELGVLRILGTPVAAGLGAGATYLDYRIFGLEGRQLDENGNWMKVELPADLKVLTYVAFTARALAGFRVLEPILGLRWEGRLHPLTYTRSLDDHILRHKEIGMETWGVGGALEASLPLGGAGRPSRMSPFLRAELDRSWGEMIQTYYADSEDTPDDETGTSQKGISTTVNHWLVAAGIRFDFGG